MTRRFLDRAAAGQALARRLLPWKGRDVLVLALPRGGVPVAAPVADALGAPLDVLVVRKIGVPWQPELGVGAIAEDGTVVFDPAAMRRLGVSEASLGRVIDRERAEIARRVEGYRRGRPMPSMAGRAVIIVDDGVAMGGTARAAMRAARRAGAAEIVLAVPVIAADMLEALRGEPGSAVAVLVPPDLGAVGEWYEDFEQVSDTEVLETLGSRTPGARGGAGRNLPAGE